MEKMLVTQALDERDLLAEKITDKIDKALFAETIKHNEEKTIERKETREEFDKNCKASFQQIMDLITRYNNINNAIITVNAETFIETSCGKMSVASAISLRARMRDKNAPLNFESQLIEKLHDDINASKCNANYKNKSLNESAEQMRNTILGKDAKTKEVKPLAVVDEYVKENTTEIVDPLNAQDKLEKLENKYNTLVKELETDIKVSNATTFIEF